MNSSDASPAPDAYTRAADKPAGRRARKRAPLARRILPWVLGGGLLLLLLIGMLPKAVPVSLAEAVQGPLRVTVFEEGKTRIRHRHTVSAPVGGFLDRVPLRAGAAIEEGRTVLATLRPATPAFLDPRSQAQAEAALQGAGAGLELRQAEAERAREMLELARKEFTRSDRLLASGSGSQSEWDNASSLVQVRSRERHAAEFALSIAGFEVAQARAALLQTESPASADERAPLSILAPVTGFVLTVFEESARIVAPGQPIMEVGDPRDLEAEIELLSSDAVAVRVGAPVSIEHWGGEHPLAGRVTLIERGGFTKISALGVEEQRVRVRVEFTDQPPAGLELGDRYRVEARIVTWEEDNVLQIPAGALFRRGNEWMAFVYENGKARRRPLEIGRQNGESAQVLRGLVAGDRVILHPPDTIDDDASVRETR